MVAIITYITMTTKSVTMRNDDDDDDDDGDDDDDDDDGDDNGNGGRSGGDGFGSEGRQKIQNRILCRHNGKPQVSPTISFVYAETTVHIVEYEHRCASSVKL